MTIIEVKFYRVIYILKWRSYSCCKRKLKILSKHTRFVTVRVEGRNFSTAQELTKIPVVEYWFQTVMEEKMQACSLEPSEDLVARIEMEKQPTVNKTPSNLIWGLYNRTVSSHLSTVISATCICVVEVACTIVLEILSQDSVYWGRYTCW